MGSQILITGSTGFLGRHLTRDLLSEGHQVRVLARDPKKARTLFSDTVEISPGDTRNPDSLRKACAGIETVYHIGGVFRFGLRRRREIYESNIDGTENLLAAAAATKVNKIVHISSASVLDRAEKTVDSWPLLSETDFPAEAPRLSPYKYSKWQAERRALDWASRGLPVVIANLSCPIGFGDETPTPTGQIIRDFIHGRFPCYCQTGLNFVNVSDVSAGLQLMAQAGRTGERYLLTNQNMWLKEFLDYLADQTGLPATRIRLPHWSVQAISCVGELIDLLYSSGSTARVCIETALQAPKAQFYDNAKAREELGWSPTPIQIGIRQALDWFQNEPGAEPSFASLPVTKSHVR